MRLTIKQLVHAAHQAARYLPKASAQLMRDLAERLDTTQAALCESLKIRDALAAENAALKEYAASHAQAIEHWNGWADAEDKIPPLPETPETDAWVNEQRAAGATRVETNLRACYEEFPESSRDIVDECIQIAANAAAQLRGSQV